jgi:hypothetical protein
LRKNFPSFAFKPFKEECGFPAAGFAGAARKNLYSKSTLYEKSILNFLSYFHHNMTPTLHRTSLLEDNVSVLEIDCFGTTRYYHVHFTLINRL